MSSTQHARPLWITAVLEHDHSRHTGRVDTSRGTVVAASERANWCPHGQTLAKMLRGRPSGFVIDVGSFDGCATRSRLRRRAAAAHERRARRAGASERLGCGGGGGSGGSGGSGGGSGSGNGNSNGTGSSGNWRRHLPPSEPPFHRRLPGHPHRALARRGDQILWLRWALCA